ncbi:mechanosensitive ion channel family protein [Pseudomonas matsuisoli]|uniref:Small-conductance mechanosensitive channel n=1 Tax=Pseudomonas matsuisoli TaxID=1515666 RepID=A0A917Q2A7_9PSED|nr:mechanosensitive ion channel domain-containing protein [Pseudomonas matsuisoli]GGK07500.1 hypothetical protein GCM10009304_37140 [Pseudomonas matsuisoli]
MDFNYDEIIRTSEAWLPVILHYAGQLTLAIITLMIGWWLINKLMGKITGLLRGRAIDQTLIGFASAIVGVALKIMLAISVASMIGVETTSFIAAIGAAGLAVGLALQGSLSNFAGGVLILLFKPFRQGDWIEAQGISGTVMSIHIFHTTIKSGDAKIIMMPNGSLSNGTVINYNREPFRRGELAIGIGYDSDIKKAREVLLDIAKDPRVLKEPAEPMVVVTALGDNAVNLAFRFWTATGDLWPVTFDFLELAKERLTEAGIEIPYPQRTVHLVQKSDAK